MGYVRYGVVAGSTVTQPNSTAATDIFGNTFDNWCADYIKHDKDGNPIAYGCVSATQGSTDWEHWNFDNTAQRPLMPYEPNVSVFDVVIPTVIEPFTVDEDDIIIEITSGGMTYGLETEDNYLVAFEDNTDITLTSATTIISTESTGDSVTTNSGHSVSIE